MLAVNLDNMGKDANMANLQLIVTMSHCAIILPIMWTCRYFSTIARIGRWSVTIGLRATNTDSPNPTIYFYALQTTCFHRLFFAGFAPLSADQTVFLQPFGEPWQPLTGKFWSCHDFPGFVQRIFADLWGRYPIDRARHTLWAYLGADLYAGISSAGLAL